MVIGKIASSHGKENGPSAEMVLQRGVLQLLLSATPAPTLPSTTCFVAETWPSLTFCCCWPPSVAISCSFLVCQPQLELNYRNVLTSAKRGSVLTFYGSQPAWACQTPRKVQITLGSRRTANPPTNHESL